MYKRKRRVLFVSLFIGAVFIMAAWYVLKKEETKRYIPGEQVEGVTTRLDRDVPPDYISTTFQDVTEQSGIQFYHFNYDRTSQLAEDMGSGVAWFDYNNDGWDDLFIVNYAAPIDQEIASDSRETDRCRMYENNGDGTFRDVSKQVGLDLAIRGMGATAADYNNDGWTDLLITTYGESILMKNDGTGTFANASKEAGIDNRSGFWAGASWGDYDRDGNLDLYITGYVKYKNFELSAEELNVEEPPSINPSAFSSERNLLYHNNGDGTFTEVARQAGVENASGRSLSASWVDINNDMWPDLYVANDVSDNVLYLNNRDGTFSDISHHAHVADYRGAMGLAIGDWDADRDMDLFITHWIAQENALYTNRWNDLDQSGDSHSLRFIDDSANHGLGQSSLDYVGWATSFVDFDLDSRPDLFVINGSTIQLPEKPEQLRPMQDQIFWNAGVNRGFYEVGEISGSYFEQEYVGRGGAISDYDRDGDPDLFIVNYNGPGILLNNRNERGNNWLSIKLEGRKSNRSGIGTRLKLVSEGLVQVRQVGSQSSYLSQNSLTQSFGIGEGSRIDSLIIVWPSGQRDIHRGISPNQVLKVVEGNSNSTALSK